MWKWLRCWKVPAGGCVLRNRWSPHWKKSARCHCHLISIPAGESGTLPDSLCPPTWFSSCSDRRPAFYSGVDGCFTKEGCWFLYSHPSRGIGYICTGDGGRSMHTRHPHRVVRTDARGCRSNQLGAVKGVAGLSQSGQPVCAPWRRLRNMQ